MLSADSAPSAEENVARQGQSQKGRVRVNDKPSEEKKKPTVTSISPRPTPRGATDDIKKLPETCELKLKPISKLSSTYTDFSVSKSSEARKLSQPPCAIRGEEQTKCNFHPSKTTSSCWKTVWKEGTITSPCRERRREAFPTFT